MRTITTLFKDHLGGECTTIAACWTITREDGTVFRFTDHDCDLTVGGYNFMAAASAMSTTIELGATLAVDNLDAVTNLSSDSITDGDLRAGLFDNAEVDLFLVNYMDGNCGVLYLAKGWSFGRVEIRDNACTVELRGLTQHLSQQIGDIYSKTCRATLGDTECGIALSDVTQTGEVASVTNRQRFVVASPGLVLTDGPIPGGRLTWTDTATDSGNVELSIEVSDYNKVTRELTLFLPMPYDIGVGDEFSFVVGCDKTAGSCLLLFDNILNFRGEPFIPVNRELKTTVLTTPIGGLPWY